MAIERSAAEFVEDLHNCQDLEEIWVKCLHRVRASGFDQLIFVKKRHLQKDALKNHADLVLYTNFSAELTAFYVEARNYVNDEFIQKLLAEGGAYSWGLTREKYQLGQLSEHAAYVHEQTRHLGSKVGYTFGFGPRLSGVAGFAVSILDCDDQEKADQLWNENHKGLTMTMSLFDIALTRYPENQKILLTDQKIRILRLIAEGKLLADVAVILNLHRRTIEDQIRSIRELLNAETTAEAVHIATRRGIL